MTAHRFDPMPGNRVNPSCRVCWRREHPWHDHARLEPSYNERASRQLDANRAEGRHRCGTCGEPALFCECANTPVLRGPCESSVCGGDYVCCLPAGHDGAHECREYGRPDRTLWTTWEDHDADDEPCWCAHTETEHIGTDMHRCVYCGTVRIEIEDPHGTTWVTTLGSGSDRRVRYECAVCGVRGCHGCMPPLSLRGFTQVRAAP